MTTRNLVPRADGEGSLGTAAKQWGAMRAKNIYINGVDVTEAVTETAEKADAAATSATNASNSASSASTTARQLMAYLEDKEELTAPAVDPTLSISEAAADAKVTGDKINEVTRQGITYNSYNILANYGQFVDNTINGVTITWSSDHETCTLTGTASGYANFNILTFGGSFPSWLKKNKKYAILLTNTDTTNVKVQVITKVGETQTTTSIDKSTYISFDNSIDDVLIRVRAINNSATYNATVSVRLFEKPVRLESTGDTSNRETDIYAMLWAFGYCELGEGQFYVKSISMPNDSTLVGCGNSTEVILLDGETGETILMKKRCHVSKIRIVGSETRQGGDDSIGDRFGIHYSSSYEPEEDEQLSTVTDCTFVGFSGAGICVYSIGHNHLQSIAVDRCNFKFNKVGFYSQNLAEFGIVSNSIFVHNYFGARYNGGNTIFSNCVFGGNRKGFVVDTVNLGNVNSGHSPVVGCEFVHNSFFGIQIRGNQHGIMFDGCTIYNNTYTNGDVSEDRSIDLYHCVGTTFANCLCGAPGGLGITTDAASGTLFNGCRFVQNTTFPTRVNKANCYLLDGTPI